LLISKVPGTQNTEAELKFDPSRKQAGNNLAGKSLYKKEVKTLKAYMAAGAAPLSVELAGRRLAAKLLLLLTAFLASLGLLGRLGFWSASGRSGFRSTSGKMPLRLLACLRESSSSQVGRGPPPPPSSPLVGGSTASPPAGRPEHHLSFSMSVTDP